MEKNVLTTISWSDRFAPIPFSASFNSWIVNCPFPDVSKESKVSLHFCLVSSTFDIFPWLEMNRLNSVQKSMRFSRRSWELWSLARVDRSICVCKVSSAQFCEWGRSVSRKRFGMSNIDGLWLKSFPFAFTCGH